MRYPPFSVLANLIVQSEKLEEVLEWSTKLGRWLQGRKLEGGAGARAGARAELAAEAHLPLSPGAEGGQVRCAGRPLREMLAVVDYEEIPRRSVVVDVDPMHLM